MTERPLTVTLINGLTWYSEDDYRALKRRVEALEATLASIEARAGELAQPYGPGLPVRDGYEGIRQMAAREGET